MFLHRVDCRVVKLGGANLKEELHESQDGVWLILKQLNVHFAAHHQHCLLLCCRWKSWLIPAGIQIFLWALKFFISSDTFMSNRAHGSVLREQLFDAFYNPEFLGSHCTFTSPELQFNTSSLTCVCVSFFKDGPAVLTAFKIHLLSGTGRSKALCAACLSVLAPSSSSSSSAVSLLIHVLIRLNAPQ